MTFEKFRRHSLKLEFIMEFFLNNRNIVIFDCKSMCLSSSSPFPSSAASINDENQLLALEISQLTNPYRSNGQLDIEDLKVMRWLIYLS